MLENWNNQHFYRVPHFTSPFTDNEVDAAASSYRNRKKLLHSSCTGQKWSIFVNYFSDLKVTDIMVGETGFEPATLWSQTRCATRLRYSPTWVLWYNNVLLTGLPSKALKGQRLVGPEGLEPPT